MNPTRRAGVFYPPPLEEGAGGRRPFSCEVHGEEVLSHSGFMRKDVLAYPLVIANPCCVHMVLEVDDGIFSFLAEPLQLAGSVPGGYHIGGLGGLAVSWRGSGGIYR